MGSSVAVVGGGWAGLSAAVHLCRLGHRVTLIEMAAHLGGRARSLAIDGMAFDNGQHILLGAYTGTLALLQIVAGDSADRLRERLKAMAEAGPANVILNLAQVDYIDTPSGGDIIDERIKHLADI